MASGGVIMIELNNRLSLCASYVSLDGFAVDVGTDHAYLSTYLVLKNICHNVIACDINDGPLLAAKQTLEKFGVSDKITLIKSDGLQNVPDKNITDVIIAGMGGELVSCIIGNAEWLKRGTNLVLQAMSKSDYLRKWLYRNGFKIIKEQVVEDEKFLYTVIKAEYCGVFVEIDDFFAETGLIDFDLELSKKYAIKQAKRLEKVASETIKSSSQKSITEKYLNLSRKIMQKVEGTQ